MFVGIEENGTPFDAENETSNNNVENTKEVIYDFLQKELIALRMSKVDSNFRGFTEWEKEQVRSPVLLSQNFSDIPIGKTSYCVQKHHSKGKISVFLRTCRRNFIN